MINVSCFWVGSDCFESLVILLIQKLVFPGYFWHFLLYSVSEGGDNTGGMLTTEVLLKGGV